MLIGILILRLPARLVGKNRSNIETDSSKVYFGITVFIPFLDFYITQIQRHLLDYEQILSSFQRHLLSNNLKLKQQFETDIVKLMH